MQGTEGSEENEESESEEKEDYKENDKFYDSNTSIKNIEEVKDIKYQLRYLEEDLLRAFPQMKDAEPLYSKKQRERKERSEASFTKTEKESPRSEFRKSSDKYKILEKLEKRNTRRSEKEHRKESFVDFRKRFFRDSFSQEENTKEDISSKFLRQR